MMNITCFLGLVGIHRHFLVWLFKNVQASSFKFQVGVRHDKVRFESLGIYSVIHELQVPSVFLLPQPTLPLPIPPLSACPSESMVDFQDPTVIAQDYCAYYMFSDLAPSR